MAWEKVVIKRENGEMVQAQAPVIISASRSTDIPAFYSDWFFHRLNVGYSAWINPFNGVKSYISYEKTRFIVFWSKNPAPLIPHLSELNNRNIGCYIQYSLNDYTNDNLENGIRASVNKRIETFKKLVDILGVGRVIWRFDPLILTDNIPPDLLLKRIQYIGDQLKGYTEKLVCSYVDISQYQKVKRNLKFAGVNYREWTPELMHHFAQQLVEVNKHWGFQLATCGEKIDLNQYGIKPNHCVDDDLMIRFCHKDAELMNFLGVSVQGVVQEDLFGNSQLPKGSIPITDILYAEKMKNNKDKGQREFCGCMVSKDIGQYNTCPHKCEYCYANASKDLALNNWKRHKANPFAETITGEDE